MTHPNWLPMYGRLRLALSVVCPATLVAGCGGGGDGGGLATLDFPIESSVAAYTQSAHQFNLSGTVGASNLSMAYSYTPGAAGTFEGMPALTAVESADLFVNGALADQVLSTSYFALNPYRFLGSTSVGSYSVFNQTANLPVTAKIGESGVIGSETEYTDATKMQVAGTTAITWSLEADSATTALFCINIQTISGVPVDGSQCYRVNPGGAVVGLVFRVNVLGQIVTLR